MKISRGFTLLEVMLTIALMAMITTSIVLVFRTGMDSWLIGMSNYEIQESATLIMDQIISGSYRFDSLREILDISTPENDSLGFIPWWKQSVPRIVPGQKIRLERKTDPNALLPVAQVWKLEKQTFQFTHLQFFPSTPSQKNEHVVFTDESLKDQIGRVFYYPTGHLEQIEMKYYWDRDRHEILRQYQGKVTPLIRMPVECWVSNFYIEYLDGVNHLIPTEKLTSINKDQLHYSPIQAVRFFLTVSKGGESYTLRSYIHIRKKGIASSGILLTEGGKVPIPNSTEIKTLSLIGFRGVGEKGYLYCHIYSEKQNQTYGLKVRFTLKNGIPWIERYEIEAPLGKVVYRHNPNIPAERGLNLLTIDPSGYFDYGLDKGATGEIDFLFDDVVLEVYESTLSGVKVLLR